MIGTKFYKENYNYAEYAECAVWCNANNAHIEERDKYYEVANNPPPEPMPPLPPSLEEQLDHISEALLTTTLTQEETIAQLTEQNEALQAQLSELSDAMVELMFSE